MEVLSLKGAIDRGIVVLQDCARLSYVRPFSRYIMRLTNNIQADPSVVDIANEWERFLLAYGETSESAPHLYLSALSWIPGNSQLWSIVHDTLSSDLRQLRAFRRRGMTINGQRTLGRRLAA